VFTARYGLGIYIKSGLILVSKGLIWHETVHIVEQKKKRKKNKNKNKKNNTRYIKEPRSYFPLEEHGLTACVATTEPSMPACQYTAL
jgi:hypothetical protein